mgnify:CR=1 FL=1
MSSAFHRTPSDRRYISLDSLVHIAKKVGGDQHHFIGIQYPLNLLEGEAVLKKNQSVRGDDGSIRNLSTYECAAHHGLLQMSYRPFNALYRQVSAFKIRIFSFVKLAFLYSFSYSSYSPTPYSPSSYSSIFIFFLHMLEVVGFCYIEDSRRYCRRQGSWSNSSYLHLMS